MGGKINAAAVTMLTNNKEHVSQLLHSSQVNFSQLDAGRQGEQFLQKANEEQWL